MRTDILILHWNNPKALIESLFSWHTAWLNAIEQGKECARQTHFWVMDNGSDFEIWDELQSLWKKEAHVWGNHIHLERSAFNRGFAAGHNELLSRVEKHADSKNLNFVAFVNSDIHVPEDFFNALEEQVVKSKTSNTIFFPTLLEHGKYLHGGQVISYRLSAKMSHKPQFDMNNVNFVCGAFWIVNFKEWTNLGRWNEKFFFYGEDLEASLRARSKGFVFKELENLVVVHQGRGSIGEKSDRAVELHFRARKLLLDHIFPKHHNGYQRLLAKFIVTTEMLVKSVFWILTGRKKLAQSVIEIASDLVKV